MQVGLYTALGQDLGQTVSVHASPFFIGRAADCDLQVTSPYVSKYHCVLVVDGDRVFVRDLESHNGTQVNGQPVEVEQQLQHGDELAIGPLRYELLVHPSPPECGQRACHAVEVTD